MSEIDWSKAPEGATHYTPRGLDVCWFRHDGEGWRSWIDGRWGVAYGSEGFFESLIPRPTQWRGPEDGLPPVGMVCEYTGSAKVPGDPSEWRPGDQVEILAHRQALMAMVAVGWNRRTGTARGSVAAILRPLKSDKERAVEAAMKVMPYPGSPSTRTDLECAYDAGLLRLPEEQS